MITSCHSLEHRYTVYESELNGCFWSGIVPKLVVAVKGRDTTSLDPPLFGITSGTRLSVHIWEVALAFLATAVTLKTDIYLGVLSVWEFLVYRGPD